jgi:hypothetical protein
MNWERVVEMNSCKTKENRKIDLIRGWIGVWSLWLISNGRKSCKEQGWEGGEMGEKASKEAERKGRGKSFPPMAVYTGEISGGGIEQRERREF